jgi:hypothetical protein
MVYIHVEKRVKTKVYTDVDISDTIFIPGFTDVFVSIFNTIIANKYIKGGENYCLFSDFLAIE